MCLSLDLQTIYLKLLINRLIYVFLYGGDGLAACEATTIHPATIGGSALGTRRSLVSVAWLHFATLNKFKL